jgi:hypothetical protein
MREEPETIDDERSEKTILTEGLWSANPSVNSSAEQIATTRSVFCTNCGTKLVDGYAFCITCGASVAESESPLLPLQSTDYLPMEQQSQYLQQEQPYYQQPQQEQPYYQQPQQEQPYYQQPQQEQPYYQQPQQEQPYYQQPQQEQQYYQQHPTYTHQTEFKGSTNRTAEKKKLSTTAVISIVAVCFIIIGFGLFYFIDPLNYFSNDPPPQSERPPQSDGEQQSGDGQQSGEEQQTGEDQPSRDPEHPAVENINITHGGVAVPEIILTEGEEVSLHAEPEPNVAYDGIEWTSSDTGVFIVIPIGATGSEARIKAVSPGVAILTAASGDAVRECIIIVLEEEVPQYFDSTLGEFYANVNNTNVGLRLEVSWVDGPQEGRESIYWRDRNSSTWYIRRVTGAVDEIEPEFAYNDSVLTISWANIDYVRTHYIFEDGTGYFSRNPGLATSVDEGLRWIITID